MKVVKLALQRAIRDRMLLLKQRAKIRCAISDDENTKFFHVSASQHFRKKLIHVLHTRAQTFSHDHKSLILKKHIKTCWARTPASKILISLTSTMYLSPNLGISTCLSPSMRSKKRSPHEPECQPWPRWL